jgi:hypothetical protein
MRIAPVAIGAVPAYLVYKHFELQRLQRQAQEAENVAVGAFNDATSTKDELAAAINNALVAETLAEEARIRMQRLQPVATVGIPASGLAALLLLMRRK